MLFSALLYFSTALAAYMVAIVAASPDFLGVIIETPITVVCNIPNVKSANYGYSKENIGSLNNGDTTTIPSMSINGTKCTRLECQYSSGIYACNDNDGLVTVDNDVLASFARSVLNNASCSSYPESDNHQIQGQAFSAAGWNVIVGLGDGDSC